MFFTQVGKIESDSEKEEKAKFASRKSGTRIAEVEKRPVVARLKADEAEWKKRDVHTRHETATLEIGKAVAWHYAPVGKPGELWFSVRKSTSASGAPDNSSLSQFPAMTRPSWLGRAVGNRHRHAIEQAWRSTRRFSMIAP